MDLFCLIVPASSGASFLFIAEGLERWAPTASPSPASGGFVTRALFLGFPAPDPPHDCSHRGGMRPLDGVSPEHVSLRRAHRVVGADGMLKARCALFIAIVAAGIAPPWPSRGIALGLAVGLAGGILMALPTFGQGRSTTLGVLMILAALVSYGFALNIARPVQQRNGALPVIWRAQAVALVLTAPLGLPELLRAHWSPASLLFSLLASARSAPARVTC